MSKWKNNGVGNDRNRKKRSGAKEVRGTTKDGNPYFGVVAWNAGKHGMLKVSAFENANSTRFTNDRGEESIMLLFEVINTSTLAKHLEVAQYKFSTGKAMLSNLGKIISTKAPNGGYFGQYKKQ